MEAENESDAEDLAHDEFTGSENYKVVHAEEFIQDVKELEATTWETLRVASSQDHLTSESVILTICNLRTRNEQNEGFITGQRRTQSKYCMSFICQTLPSAERLNNLRLDYENTNDQATNWRPSG